MSSTNENFCLKWNDFQQNIATNYRDLRESSDFSDVTLVCEEDQQVEAHRVILSACSPFFMNILKKTKHIHPMIYMRGLKTKDLLAIVDFIYRGETNIFQDDLDGFLAIADELQLKGLSGGDSKDDSNDVDTKPQELVSKQMPILGSKTTKLEEKIVRNLDREFLPNIVQEIQNHEISDIQSYKEETDRFMNSSITSMVSVYNHDELDGQIASMTTKTDGKWSCKVCGKVARDKTNISQHIEANHIEGVSHPCDQCGKVSRSRHALAYHVYASHKSF